MRVIYHPPLAHNVAEIVKGQTTQTEIQELFGVPLISAEGSQISFYPESPMGRLWAQSPVPVAGRFPYSSIDDEHIAFLFLEQDSTSTRVSGGNWETATRHNRLLIFINKKTGTVDEYSYWEEFEAD
jgi:hypothetical protein